MQKPTQEEIDALLECAKVVGGNFARLAAAYRAKCEEDEVYIHDLESGYEAQEARAEMLERQYGELVGRCSATELGPGAFYAMIALLIARHTAEREGK